MTTPPSSLPLRKTETDLSKTISDLEKSLIEAVTTNASLNRLLDLVNLLERPADAHGTSKAIYALYRVFTVIIATGKLTIPGGGDAKLVRTWIWDRLNSYVDFLASLLKDEEKSLRVCLRWFLRGLAHALYEGLRPRNIVLLVETPLICSHNVFLHWPAPASLIALQKDNQQSFERYAV
jgi:hypothetical protein